MKRMLTEEKVIQIIREYLIDQGIEINEDGELEFNIPVVFDEAVKDKNGTVIHNN